MATRSLQELVLVEQTNRIMGTDVSIHLAVSPEEERAAQIAIEAGMAWLHEVERQLTRFHPESDLCRLNRAAGQWHSVSDLLFTAVQEAISAAESSDGLFDPTLLPQLEALGYDRDFSEIAHSAADSPARFTAAPFPGGSWRDIQLDAKRQRIRLPRGARLDLGGIAKGWAADVALQGCLGAFANAIVNVGGDLHLRGERQEGEPWSVGIRDPQYDHLPGQAPNSAIIAFGQGGLATSGATSRWWYHAGTRQHHLLDPRTGRPASLWIHPNGESPDATNPAQLIATATALAPSAARAEVAAKVAILRGYPEALSAVEHAWEQRNTRHAHLPADQEVALLLILGNGEMLMSRNMQEYLNTCAGGGMVWL